jgi:hypothetical protein
VVIHACREQPGGQPSSAARSHRSPRFFQRQPADEDAAVADHLDEALSFEAAGRLADWGAAVPNRLARWISLIRSLAQSPDRISFDLALSASLRDGAQDAEIVGVSVT